MLSPKSCHNEELRFVTTSGHVKYVPAGVNFSKKNVFSFKICIELQDLHSPSVILNCVEILHTQLNSNKKATQFMHLRCFFV